ncbi:MAG: hypothetical protein ACREJM_15830, partial [Candidatus Saccharimonadales bacterium]
MADSFDPYHVWLGIPRDRRPPTHYQLLAISPDEQDRTVINAAVARQSAYVRNFQIGKHGADAARILNEVQVARICLLDPAKRAAYDAQLERESPVSAAAQAAQPAGIALDLDALAHAAAAESPATRTRRPAQSLRPFSKHKSPPWRLPAVGAGVAVVLVIVGLLASRRGGGDTAHQEIGQAQIVGQADTAPPLVPAEPPRAARTTQPTDPGDSASEASPRESEIVDAPPVVGGDGQDTAPSPPDLSQPVDVLKPIAEPPQPPPAGAAVDLLALVDLDRDVVSGEWKFEGRALEVAASWAARIELP